MVLRRWGSITRWFGFSVQNVNLETLYGGHFTSSSRLIKRNQRCDKLSQNISLSMSRSEVCHKYNNLTILNKSIKHLRLALLFSNLKYLGKLDWYWHYMFANIKISTLLCICFMIFPNKIHAMLIVRSWYNLSFVSRFTALNRAKINFGKFVGIP